MGMDPRDIVQGKKSRRRRGNGKIGKVSENQAIDTQSMRSAKRLLAGSAKWYIGQKKLLRALTPKPYNEAALNFTPCTQSSDDSVDETYLSNSDETIQTTVLFQCPVASTHFSSNSRYRDVLSLVSMLEQTGNADAICSDCNMLSLALQRITLQEDNSG